MFQPVLYLLKSTKAVDEPEQDWQMEIKGVVELYPDQFLSKDTVHMIIGAHEMDAAVLAYFSLN